MLSNVQKPELLIEAFFKLEKRFYVELYFIGNSNVNNYLKNISNRDIKFIDFLPHKDYLKFMCENIDIGFVSLTKDYYGACVPSKIYEYINLELPKGDAIDLINENNFGLASSYLDIDLLSNNINMFLDEDYLRIKKEVLRENKKIWSMENKINELQDLLRKVI